MALSLSMSLIVAWALVDPDRPALAGLAASHHDFGGQGWSGQRRCLPCHTPHNARTNAAAPLWNRPDTTASFTPYASPTLNAAAGQPTGTSLLCLSCHDGTIALDAFGGRPGSLFLNNANFGYTGTDLSRHHPISIVYDSALATADGALRDPATAASGLGGTIATDLLYKGRLECTSCHDVHLKRASGCSSCHMIHGGGGTKTLSLWKDNTASALCLTCHIK